MEKVLIETWQLYLGFIILLASMILNVYQFMIIKPIKENYKEIKNTMQIMSDRIAALESRTSSTETAICYLQPEKKVGL